MLYACPNVATTHRLVRAQRPAAQPGAGAGRGPRQLRARVGARRAGLQARPRSARAAPAQPRRAATSTPGVPWSSNQLRECYRVARRRVRLGRAARRTTGTLRDGRHRLGWGMAAACYPVYRIASHAAVRIDADGRVVVRCGTQDIGTRHRHGPRPARRRARSACRSARVAVELGDTRLPEGPYLRRLVATAPASRPPSNGRGAPAPRRPDRARHRRPALAAARARAGPGQHRRRPRDARGDRSEPRRGPAGARGHAGPPPLPGSPAAVPPAARCGSSRG